MDNQIYENSTALDKISNSSSPRQPTEQEIFETNYNSIIDLVREFKANEIKHVEKRHLETALQIILWPSNENVWEKAEAICMAKVKHILENMFSDDPHIATGLKECLQAILYLGEISNTEK
jgi:hypothetical protein